MHIQNDPSLKAQAPNDPNSTRPQARNDTKDRTIQTLNDPRQKTTPGAKRSKAQMTQIFQHFYIYLIFIAFLVAGLFVTNNFDLGIVMYLTGLS